MSTSSPPDRAAGTCLGSVLGMSLVSAGQSGALGLRGRLAELPFTRRPRPAGGRLLSASGFPIGKTQSVAFFSLTDEAGCWDATAASSITTGTAGPVPPWEEQSLPTLFPPELLFAQS